jgi:capsular polysaccharide transport system permease protein
MMKQGLATLTDRTRVTAALLEREARKRFGSSSVGLYSVIMEPLIQVGFFALIFFATSKATPHGTSTLAFMISGVMPFQMISKSISKGMGGVSSSSQLFAYGVIWPIDTILSRILLEVIVYTCVFAGLYFACIIAEIATLPSRPQYLIYAWLLAISFGTSLTIIFAALQSLIGDIAKTIAQVINRFAFLTSGVFFSASMMPQVARDLLLWNPILNLVEMVRYSVFMEYPKAYFSTSYVVIVNVVLMAVALNLFYFAQTNPKTQMRRP